MKFIIILILLSLSTLAYGSQSITSDTALYSTKVVDIDTNDIIFEHNSQISVSPASTLKTFTFYLASKYLDANFKFVTKVFLDNENNLYIKFVGDPTLTAHHLETLLLNSAPLTGYKFNNIYLDGGDDFGNEPYAPGTPIDNIKFCYAAPVTPIMIDKNCASFNQMDSGILKYQNDLNLIGLKYDIENAILNEPCQLELFNLDSNNYELSGCYDKNNTPKNLKIAVKDPKKYVFDFIASSAKKNKIYYKEILFGKVSQGAKLIGVNESEKLSKLLKDMMYQSDNQIADAILKTLTYNYYKKPASWFLVEQFVKLNLKKDFNQHIESLRIYDGSGVSYKNKVTTDFMISLLNKIYNDPLLRQSYFDSVPTIGSINSTLEKRFTNIKLKGQLYAKTGAIDNVLTLAGFYTDADHKIYAYCIFINNFMDTEEKMLKAQQDILESIFD